MNTNSRAYLFLPVAAVMLSLAAFFIGSNYATDIMFHDTYLMFGRAGFVLLSCGILLAIWLIHFPFRLLFAYTTLSWLHVLLSVVAVACFLFSPLFLSLIASRSVASDLDSGAALTGNLSVYELLLNVGVVLFIAGQLAFIVNVIIGTIHHRKSKPSAG